MGNAKVSTKLAAVNAVTKVVKPYSSAVPGTSRKGKVVGAGVGGVTGLGVGRFFFEDFWLFFDGPGGGGGGPFLPGGGGGGGPFLPDFNVLPRSMVEAVTARPSKLPATAAAAAAAAAKETKGKETKQSERVI